MDTLHNLNALIQEFDETRIKVILEDCWILILTRFPVSDWFSTLRAWYCGHIDWARSVRLWVVHVWVGMAARSYFGISIRPVVVCRILIKDAYKWLNYWFANLTWNNTARNWLYCSLTPYLTLDVIRIFARLDLQDSYYNGHTKQVKSG